MSNLLATIVASRKLQPEPVATDALVHLCATSKAAASSMSNLLSELCPGTTTTGLRFTGQDIVPDVEGRPDLVASDTTGTRLVVEAKFDAALTKAQVSGAYVGKLTAGTPAALVFLVPRDRMRNLWSIISVTPGGALAPTVLPDGAEEAGVASMPLGTTNHVLAVVSWESLLNRLSSDLSLDGDRGGAAELAQIAGLVKWRTSTGWIPVMQEDLPPRVGRQLQSLTEVIKAVCSRASSKKVRNGSADGGFGRHITTPSGKSMWVGTWLNWWDEHGPGPAWAQVSLKTTQEMALTSQALTEAGIGHHARQQANDVLVPLALPLGAEREAVEIALLAQVKAVIAAVDALAVEVVEQDGDSIDVP
ncbi:MULTISPECIES: hypothetical protein [unclassified Nocardioides]|uniref:hypothetical protein n=1 Tax=unclassified Nocardioides TaxID=2615069 RepID=UPI003014C090